MESHEPAHPRPTFLSDFILGCQDGLVNVLGILLGLAAAAQSAHIILIAALAALGAESISMGAVAYTSTAARRSLYLSEELRERQEMREIPQEERAEVRAVLERWGYTGAKLEEMLDRIAENPKAMLEFMMAFELGLAPVTEEQPRQSALLVFSATVAGSFIPLIPFFVPATSVRDSALASVLLSGIVLFFIGYYSAKTTLGSVWKNGLQMLVIGLGAGFAGFVIGHFLGAAPG